jgi:hypothetical protein
MAALLVDVLIYGVPTAIGIGALALVGRYYGRTPPPPNPPDQEPPKDE